jgi:hypothetical protein
MAPHDETSIPLNAEDPTLEIRRTRRDTSGDPHREPGLIDLRRHEGVLRGRGWPRCTSSRWR